MIKKLINPIANFDEKVLLGVGFLSVAIAVVAGYLLGYKFDAIFHITFAARDWADVAFTTLRSYGIAIAGLFILGLLINRRTRFIDILNTVVIANLPMVLLLLIQKFPFVANSIKEASKSPKDMTSMELSFLFIVTLISVPILIFCFAILYNGFKTSTNMKEWYHVALFFVVAVAASFTQMLFF